MININKDYCIESDGRNYILCRDLHRIGRRRNEDGTITEYPDYQTLGYYGSLSGALRGLSGHLALSAFADDNFSLREAIEKIQSINKEMRELLERYEDDLK